VALIIWVFVKIHLDSNYQFVSDALGKERAFVRFKQKKLRQLPRMLHINKFKTYQTGYTNHDRHKLEIERDIIDKPDKLVKKPDSALMRFLRILFRR